MRFLHNVLALCKIILLAFKMNILTKCYKGKKSKIKHGVLNEIFNRMSFHINTHQFHKNINLEDIHEVSVTQIKKTLNTNKGNFSDGFTCFKTECSLCENPSKQKKPNPTIYINKITGLFVCPSCQYTSQWNKIEKFLTMPKTAQGKKDLTNLRNEITACKSEYITDVDKAIQLYDIIPSEFENIIKKFKLNKISSSVLSVLNLKIDSSKENLYFPLTNVENKTVGYKILNCRSGIETTSPAHGCSGILIPNKTNLTKSHTTKDHSAVLVPTVKDFLALCSQKLSVTPVCLPHGLQILPQQCLPALENFTKLVLWFPGDAVAWDSARNLARKLDEKRCLFVRPMDEQPPAAEALSRDLDLRQIVNSAQPIWHRAITNFKALRQDVLSDLQNIDKVAGVKWKRFPILHRILKGHRRGELTILTGPTGSGKTTFMSEYSLDLAMQGVSTLWGSFEIRNARLARGMLQQMCGVPLDEHLNQFDEFADRFEKLPIYFMTFHGQQSLKVVMEAVIHATYVHDISHVIIDNVQFMMGLSDESRHLDRFWKQDSIIAAFRTFATQKNCHVTLVIHPRKERDEDDLTTSSIFGGAKASQEADNVLIIQDKRLTSTRGKKYLQIAKNRYSGDLGVMPLEFDKSSLSYQRKKKLPEEKEQIEKTNETHDEKR